MDRRLAAPLVAEGVGALLFFFVGAGAIIAGGDLVAVALAHGLVLAVMVSAFGAVSGGHFNPAVTFGIWITGRIPTTTAAWYVVAQLVGGAIAGLLLLVVFPQEQWAPSTLGTPTLGDGVSAITGIVVETLLTMVLLFAVLGTAVDRRAPKIGGLAIGLAVGADILMGGPLTGAAMNPARWFGTAVGATVGGAAFQEVWAVFYVYLVGPLLGAGIAAALWRYLFFEEAEPERVPADPTA